MQYTVYIVEFYSGGTFLSPHGQMLQIPGRTLHYIYCILYTVYRMREIDVALQFEYSIQYTVCHSALFLPTVAAQRALIRCSESYRFASIFRFRFSLHL